MNELVAWTEEPTGPEYSYMVRASTSDLKSFIDANFEFPNNGYVQSRAPHGSGIMNKPGIYGYIHGMGSFHTPFSMYYMIRSIVWQIVVVKNSEVAFNFTDRDRSCRAPRAWVKWTGSKDEILNHLRAENNPYSGLVADNFEEEYKVWEGVFKPIMLQRLHQHERFEVMNQKMAELRNLVDIAPVLAGTSDFLRRNQPKRNA